MADHLVLFVDRLIRPAVVQPGGNVSTQNANSSSGETPVAPSSSQITDAHGESDVEAPLIQMAECRICQEEDNLRNLETPCACNGSLKYAHRKCVQHWCNEKRDTTCEICHQPYQKGYTCPSPPPPPADAAIDIGGGWRITGAPLSWQDPRILAVAEGEGRFLEAEYDEYEEDVDGSGAMFCRSAVLILMALLLLRHALSVTDPDEDDDTSTFFSLFLLRAASFLLPCYVMAWAISILQRRRQRQEAAAAAAASSSAMAASASQLSFVLQQPSGQRRGLHLSIAPLPPPRQEEPV